MGKFIPALWICLKKTFAKIISECFIEAHIPILKTHAEFKKDQGLPYMSQPQGGCRPWRSPLDIFLPSYSVSLLNQIAHMKPHCTSFTCTAFISGKARPSLRFRSQISLKGLTCLEGDWIMGTLYLPVGLSIDELIAECAGWRWSLGV